jgi:hypothetical protein
MKAVKEKDALNILTNHKVYGYAAIVDTAEFVFITQYVKQIDEG